jgi:tRNA (cmo5U34)-methyltransferase
MFLRLRETGGSLWVYDMVDAEIPAVRAQQKRRYGEYLAGLRDEAYRDHVFAYIEKEDTPSSLAFQLDLLRSVGFERVDVVHASTGFAAYGAV